MKRISMSDIRQSRFANWLRDFCNRNWVVKILAIIIIWIVVSIPFDIYLLVRWGIGPSTFWEEIALMLDAMIAIGWVQGILLFFGIGATIVVIAEDL